MYQTKILIAEDDPSHRDVLTQFLSQEGYKILQAQDGAAALRAIHDGVDLAVLDLQLPLMDGLNVVRHARRDGVRTPIMIVSGRTDEVDRIVSFEAGVDDYVPKPFLPREVVCRVKAILARIAERGTGGNQALRYDRLEIDEAAHEVRIDGEIVTLRPREFSLLIALARNPNIALSRRRLMERAWGDDYYGDERAIDGHIRRIRARFAECPEPVNYIVTVYGYGYKFCPP